MDTPPTPAPFVKSHRNALDVTVNNAVGVEVREPSSELAQSMQAPPPRHGLRGIRGSSGLRNDGLHEGREVVRAAQAHHAHAIAEHL